jgi:hypothetical protein
MSGIIQDLVYNNYDDFFNTLSFIYINIYSLKVISLFFFKGLFNGETDPNVRRVFIYLRDERISCHL